jgi:hypothetical protein
VELAGHVGGVERELDLADQEATAIVAVGRDDVDLGVRAGPRPSPPGLRRLPARVVDREVGDAGSDDLLPALAEVREPRGLALDIELASLEQRAVGSTKRYQ